ncbi:DUF4249 family protein [Candidatus Neomarinimicrobiota bacterium]
MSSNFKSILIALIVPGLFLFSGCELPTEQGEYQENLVVFGHLTANSPVVDTVYVSRSSSIDESHETAKRWISDAKVVLSDGATVFQLEPVPGRPGRYLDLSQAPNIIEPNRTYTLTVEWGYDLIQASTTVPDEFSLRSINIPNWDCQGESIMVPEIELHLESNTSQTLARALYTGDFAGLVVDTVLYREGPCFSTSFASVPLFALQWEAGSAPGVIRTVTVALDDGMENAIVDTSFAANIFKESMLVDEVGNYYRSPVFTWNSASEIIPFSWLYFNYSGLHLITVETTDNSMQEYFEGDPLRQNPYVLPNSNIEGGYGLFYSSFARSFLVEVQPDPSQG